MAPPHRPSKGRRQRRVADPQAECIRVYDQSFGGLPKYSAQGVGVDGDNRESLFGGYGRVR